MKSPINPRVVKICTMRPYDNRRSPLMDMEVWNRYTVHTPTLSETEFRAAATTALVGTYRDLRRRRMRSAHEDGHTHDVSCILTYAPGYFVRTAFGWAATCVRPHIGVTKIQAVGPTLILASTRRLEQETFSNNSTSNGVAVVCRKHQMTSRSFE
jgi:hypothetical protein